MEVSQLLKQMIQIPSYVDSDCNESDFAKYLEGWIKKNIDGFKVKRQPIDKRGKRFNLICGNTKSPKIFLNGHVDTVQPQVGWNTDPLRAFEKDGKIIGLGASDMKGSIAAFLCALREVAGDINLNELMVLFYLDEEYDFSGMKRFVKDKININPRVVVSMDGSEDVYSGCRGLVELDVEFKGRTGHSARPFAGRSVITGVTDLIRSLEQVLSRYSDVDLGPSTVNLAYLRGGVISEREEDIIWRREGNIIPNFADSTIEVRAATKKITSDFVSKKIGELAKSMDLKVEVKRVRHDLGIWATLYNDPELERIRSIYKEARVPFRIGNRMFAGYLDVQMLTDRIGAPMYMIGPDGENAHGADEFVYIKSLKNITRVYKQLLLEYCKK